MKQKKTKMTEAEIIAMLFMDLYVFGGFHVLISVFSRLNLNRILSMRPEYARSEVTIVESGVLTEIVCFHVRDIIRQNNIALPADITVDDAVQEFFHYPGSSISEYYRRGFPVSERITAIFDLAERGLDSETFQRVMTIVVDLHVNPNVALLIDHFAGM